MSQLLGSVSLVAICICLLTGCLLNDGGASATGNYIDATVCELAVHPGEFNNRLVRVRASIGSDGIEHTVLKDDTCPDNGVALSVSSEAEQKDWALRALHEAISRLGLPGTSDNKKISGIFLGKFTERTKDFPPRLFSLEKVLDLTIHIKGDGSKEAGR